MPEGDTQADLTERARAIFNAWMRTRPADTYQSSIMATEAMRLIDLYAAALQSEREAAAAEARRAAIALLRNPSSDMLNRAADDIRREIEPLQRRAKHLLDAVADQIERAETVRTVKLACGHIADGKTSL